MRFERLTRIENYVLQHGNVSLESLAQQFHLSVNTIRRDVIELEKRGCISRVRGGVVANIAPRSPAEVDNRHQRNAEGKQIIGSQAATLVHDGQTIFIDGGSTAKCVVPHLADKRNITVITSSIHTIIEAFQIPSITLFVLGGQYSLTSDTLYPSTESLNNFNIDIAFLGTTGISVDGGLTAVTLMETSFKRNAIKRSKEVVIMADHNKFGVRSTSKFAELSEATAIISDAPLDPETAQYCKHHGIQMIFPAQSEDQDTF